MNRIDLKSLPDHFCNLRNDKTPVATIAEIPKVQFIKYPDTWLFSQCRPTAVSIGTMAMHGKCIPEIHLRNLHIGLSCDWPLWPSISGMHQQRAELSMRLHQKQFLPRDALLSAVYAVVVCLSVCLSVCVCVSVTLRYCIKTAKRRITQITPHDSPLTLVF